MNTKIVLPIMLAILFLGIFLRFYKLSTNFIFGMDQSEDMYNLVSIHETLKDGRFSDLPIIGEPGTYKTNENIPISRYPVYSGVFYLYFLLPIAILTSFDPVGLVMFFAAMSAIAIFAIYLVGKELFDNRTGLIAAFLFSTSYFINIYGRTIWTPSLIPCFVVFALYRVAFLNYNLQSSSEQIF